MAKFFGWALLGVGVLLLAMGISAADSISSQFSRMFSGKPTDRSIWLMVGGVVSILVGAGMTFRGRSSRS